MEVFKPLKPIIDDARQRSFGRVKARKLGQEQLESLQEKLPLFTLDTQLLQKPKAIFPDTCKKLFMEIGFGTGEHIAGVAKANPDAGFIGCEPFINGVARLLKYITEGDIQNIRIFNGDARIIVDALPDASLDRIYVLFPDPWPKAKHYKKRIICKDTLETFARVIKKGGVLQVASDHEDYCEWIARHLEEITDFEESHETKNNRQKEPEGWVKTKYQIKAEREGRTASFFRFVRK